MARVNEALRESLRIQDEAIAQSKIAGAKVVLAGLKAKMDIAEGLFKEAKEKYEKALVDMPVETPA